MIPLSQTTRRTVLATAGVAVVMVLALLAEGRRGWCACGRPTPWSHEVNGPHNSQHLLDPYTLSHVLHGLIFYGLLAVALPRLGVGWRLVIAAGLEAAWEVAENSPIVIDRYRAATAAVGYTGDSVTNSVGDLVSCLIGFGLARWLGWRWSAGVFVAVELLMLACIRDNLTLNVVMLVYPLPAVRDWQAGG